MTLVLSKRTNLEDIKDEISKEFQAISVLCKHLPDTEGYVIERLADVINNKMQNVDMLRHKMVQLKIANRWRS